MLPTTSGEWLIEKYPSHSNLKFKLKFAIKESLEIEEQ